LKGSSNTRFNYEITKLRNLPNCKINQGTPPEDKSGQVQGLESGKHEGSGVSKEDLRQVQDRTPQGRGARDLRKLETQTETGIKKIAKIGNCQKLTIENCCISTLDRMKAQFCKGPNFGDFRQSWQFWQLIV